MHDEQFARGRQTRLDMFGPKGVKALDEADEFMAPLQEIVTRFAFGEIWEREGLDRKTRSLITIAMLVCQAKPTQLKNHVRGALANGVTRKEIREVLMHTVAYAGIPAASDAFIQAHEIFTAMDEAAS